MSLRLTRQLPQYQRGMVATLTAVIVLIATLLAMIALITSVNTSSTISGNMSFRQGLIQESERAYADVNTGFSFDVPADNVDIPGSGYYATIQPATTRPDVPDVLTMTDPTGAGAKMLPSVSTQNKLWYVIERLCNAIGPATKNTCITPLASVSGGSATNQTGDQGNTNFQPGVQPAYRLTVRVDGPRNATGYMQTIVR